ncbi:MAG: hypothetical protein ACYCTE_15215, partial [Acidimicrobiales bacterium]
TREMDAMAILQHALNAKSPVVRGEDANGRPVVLADATQSAIEKAQLVVEAFDDWLLREDPERSAAALRTYNDTFNSYVARPYSDIEIPAPGLSSDFTLRPHQKAAVARAVLSGNTGLWHEVGTGKTAVMVVAAMEQKRLGLIARPMFVVANNMLRQFATDIVRLYPAAEVLVIDKDDVSPKSRALFAARVRSHDYDAIVITHSSFTRWPVSPSVEAEYRREKIAELCDELTALGSGELRDAGRVAVKKIEKRIASHEARLSEMGGRLGARQDEHEMYFDQSGVDFLLVDEADEFKNAEMHSCVNGLRGVAVGKGSQRAFDLDVKLSFLRTAHPARQCIQATGTPISNTVAELWVFARYLRPDLLDELGVASFDDFRRQFCDTVSAMELDVTQSYRRVERLARYKNLPELARLLAEFADIVRAEDIGLERPALVGGRRQIVAVPPAPELESFIRDELTSRVEAVRARLVKPDEDNMLKLSGDARFASFDWTSFRGEQVADSHSSIAAAAQNVARIYHENKDRRYLSTGGVVHPRPGALQLVFSDLATPGGSRARSAYDDLRERLVGLGVPAEMVRFAHEFDRGDEAMAEMAEQCRDGRIAVLVGSTSKLGVGVNVQDRALALHHLDCPWRPRDIEQRQGRICRQGNQNKEVAIYAYVSERSFFVYGWQTVERKAAFVGQVMRATPDGPRSLVIDDDEVLSYGEIKAVATGDADFLRLAEIEESVARLERLERSYARARTVLGREIDYHERGAETSRGELVSIRPYAQAVSRHGKAPLPIAVDGEVYDTIADAAQAIAAAGWWSSPDVQIPALGVRVTSAHSMGKRYLAVEGAECIRAELGGYASAVDLATALRGLVRALRGLPERAERIDGFARRDEAEAARKRVAQAEPFAHKVELDALRADLVGLRGELEDRYSGARGSVGEAGSAAA